MTHQERLQLAEQIDSFRVFPRIVMIALFWLLWDVIWYLLPWYTKVPAAERTSEASGFAWGVVLVVAGMFKLALTDYLAKGRDWNARSPVVTSSTTTSSQVTATGTALPSPAAGPGGISLPNS